MTVWWTFLGVGGVVFEPSHISLEKKAALGEFYTVGNNKHARNKTF